MNEKYNTCPRCIASGCGACDDFPRCQKIPDRNEEWCGVDECPASVCGGPHVEVTDGNLTFIILVVEPSDEP